VSHRSQAFSGFADQIEVEVEYWPEPESGSDPVPVVKLL
jgi:hypothetical protein